MGIYGGLQRPDWEHWGRFTTFKSNAAEILQRSLRPEQAIYCSPLVDPYQPAEVEEAMMPRLMDAVIARPPRVFVIQTRGPLILRDLGRLQTLARLTRLRVSFSITTDCDDVRQLYEPLCAPISERFAVVRRLREAGIAVHATLAPLLPCDPEELVGIALEATDQDIIGDALHVRSVKPRGATTRSAAFAISHKYGFSEWLDAEFQAEIVERIARVVRQAGRRFGTGPEGFRWLTS